MIAVCGPRVTVCVEGALGVHLTVYTKTLSRRRMKLTIIGHDVSVSV